MKRTIVYLARRLMSRKPNLAPGNDEECKEGKGKSRYVHWENRPGGPMTPMMPRTFERWMGIEIAISPMN